MERNRKRSAARRTLPLLPRTFSPKRASFSIETLGRDIVRAFRELQEAGVSKSSPAPPLTAFLPLLQDFPEAQRAQIRIGCDNYREMFGREPRGFWLPECGLQPGLDLLLQEANMRWFVLDTHGLMFARPRPLHAIFAPCFTPAGPAAFARDQESNREVWSAEERLPRAIRFTAIFTATPALIVARRSCSVSSSRAGLRKFSGLKYHRVTRHRDRRKNSTIPPGRWRRCRPHADDFLSKRAAHFRAAESDGLRSIVVSPFDAELFGHWWFEGPRFLESVLRQASRQADDFRLTTPSDFLAAHPTQQIVRLNPSSWGENGFSSVWLDESNAWIYPRLHAATCRMIDLARDQRKTNDPMIERSLRQAARELLLAQVERLGFPHQNAQRAGICGPADQGSSRTLRASLRSNRRRTD